MTIKYNSKSFFLFDLDDTLYNEIDFLKSGYYNISSILAPFIGRNIYDEMLNEYNNGTNVFAFVLEKYGSAIPYDNVNQLLDIYRYHLPSIQLNDGVSEFLTNLKNNHIKMGIITDGRSITQRNKLKALGIEDYFTDIIISEEFGSEKPNPSNYLYFLEKYPDSEFYFFGDNTTKDFIVPLKLGWTVFCLKNRGHNIHPQQIDKLLPACTIIELFKEVELYES